MDFYVFRHGQTDWNRERRIQGHSNIPLNEEGRLQAAELRETLSHLNLDIIFSSDLDRAYETALIASDGLGIEVIKEPRLREAHFGQAEGMLIEDIVNTFGEDSWARFMKLDPNHLDISFPDGETRRNSIHRMRSVIEELINKNEYKRVGISTHGGVVRNLLGSYLMEKKTGENFDIPIPNCVVYQLSYKAGEAGEFNVSGPLK